MVAPTTTYSDGGWLNFKDVDGLILNGTGQIDGRGSIWWPENPINRVYLFMFNIQNFFPIYILYSIQFLKIFEIKHVGGLQCQLAPNGRLLMSPLFFSS